MGKWIESPDQPKKRNLRATLLVWILGKLSKVVDFLTLDLMTGKSWVKKDVAASLRSAEASPHEAEHQAWRAWYITKEAGTPKAQLLAEAVIKAFHAAQAMSRAQVAALPASSPSSPAETK